MEYRSPELKTLLKQIEEGAIVDQSQLLPYLTLESKAERYEVNLQLARAYYRRYELSQDVKALAYARACIDRALLLGGGVRRVDLLDQLDLGLLEEGVQVLDVRLVEVDLGQGGRDFGVRQDAGMRALRNEELDFFEFLQFGY